MPSLPVQRSLKHLRDEGWTVAIVEKWNQYARRRIDVFGFADLLAMHPHGSIALVQCCAGSTMGAHRDKMLAIPELEKWKAAGGRVFLMAWAKKGPRGKRKTWTLRFEEL